MMMQLVVLRIKACSADMTQYIKIMHMPHSDSKAADPLIDQSSL